MSFSFEFEFTDAPALPSCVAPVVMSTYELLKQYELEAGIVSTPKPATTAPTAPFSAGALIRASAAAATASWLNAHSATKTTPSASSTTPSSAPSASSATPSAAPASASSTTGERPCVRAPPPPPPPHAHAHRIPQANALVRMPPRHRRRSPRRTSPCFDLGLPLGEWTF